MRHITLVFLVAVFSLAAAATTTAAPRADDALPPHVDKAVCTAHGPGTASCDAHVATKPDGETPLATTSYAGGYAPADLASAYRWADPAGSTWFGTGPTVAIVDAYDNPNAYGDLTAYRRQFGLPPCSTVSGCFLQVNQNGQASPLPPADTAWGQEIDLDIEMVSAVCPQCKILLVEASSNSLDDLGAAVNRAVQMGAAAVSNSYGTSGEFGTETTYDAYYNNPNVTITASSGDNGYGVEFPAASNHVVAVGGTSLARDSSARGWTESAWSGSGSGCSSYFSKPSWQADPGCSTRTVTDVAAVADPRTGVAVYDSYGSTGGANWYVFGGTSVASPIIASVFALAGNATSVDYPARLLYASASGLFDVTSGSNGNCAAAKKLKRVAYLCTAGAGYDGPTGLGTPNGTGSF